MQNNINTSSSVEAAKKNNFTIDNKLIEKVLRIGISSTFFGHGYLALGVKASWIPLLMAYGFSKDTAIFLLPLIGVMDMMVCVCMLFYPIQLVVLWAFLWALSTAYSRPLSGEPIIEFIERASNWTVPLVLFFMQGVPKKLSDFFRSTN